MKVFRFLILSAALLLSHVVVAADSKIAVVASFSILGDVVANVGGERITVTTLVGPDKDAHVFQPAPDHIKMLSRARLVVVNGLGFEGWMARLVKSANYRGDIVVASDGIAVRDSEDDDHDHDAHEVHEKHEVKHDHQHGRNDPHAWQNPANIIVYTRNIAAALSKLDPAGTAVYQKNSADYIAKLKQLDAWALQQFAQIPAAKRKVITSHDAFADFGAHFQIRLLAPQGVATESEPSAKEVARLIRQIRQEKIRAVFIENMSSPKLLQQLAKEAGVTLGGKLYSDALSQSNGPASTYLLLMRYNIEQLLGQLKLN